MLIAQHDGFADRAVLVFLELELAQVAVGLLAVSRLHALEVLPEPEGAVPGGRAGNAGAGGDACQARMAEHGHRAARDHRQRLHVHGEGVDLHAVDLVAGEGARQRVDADIFGLDVASRFVELRDRASVVSTLPLLPLRRTAWRPRRAGRARAGRPRSVP